MILIIESALIFLVFTVVADRLDKRREWRNMTDLERRAIGNSKRFDSWWHRWLTGRARRLPHQSATFSISEEPVSFSERRRSPRQLLTPSSPCHIIQNDTLESGLIVDRSHTGARITSQLAASMGSELVICIPRPGLFPLQLAARVVWSSGHLFGVEFRGAPGMTPLIEALS